MDPRVIAQAARAGNLIERVIASLRPGGRRPTGRLLRIIPYRSLGDSRVLTVRGRVVRMVPTTVRKPDRHGAIPAREHLAAIYRAFDVEDVPYATVVATCGGVEVEGACDEGGFFALELKAPPEAPWHGGWHAVTVRGTHEVTVEATVDVFVPSTAATLAIVSDLDDTAMDTNTTRTFRMLRTVLLRSALRREEVPGIPSLYRALHAGLRADATNPLSYISSSAWNLYDSIVDYLDAHELPRGPVILHDWGSRQRSFHTVTFEHKGAHVGALLDRYATLPFLLIGDDVNEDPELYAMLAADRPGRVAAIWIRTLRRGRSRRAEIEALRSRVERAGTELLVADNTAAFRNAAVERGWIRAEI